MKEMTDTSGAMMNIFVREMKQYVKGKGTV